METVERTPAEVFPPGEFIREEIEARGWSQVEFAEILGRPPRLVSELIAGKRAVTPETARGLAQAFGTSAQLWMNLESSYQLSKVVHDGSNSISRRAKLYEIAPVKEMIRRHWIEPTENIDVLEKCVLKFLRIDSVEEQPQLLPHAARKSTSYADHSPSEIAWLFRVRQLAQAVDVKPYSEQAFSGALAKLKNLLRNPEDTRQVPRVLAEAGVRFLIVETLPQTRIDGACLWLDDHSPVIALTLRFDRIDGFWHTLLHECKHIKQKDGLDEGGLLDKDLVGETTAHLEEKPITEKSADEFAAGFTIPKGDLDNFISRVYPLFSKTKILGLAARLDIHPGIVVGQLQYRKAIPYSHSREMLAKVRNIVTDSALTDGFGSILATAV
ncbi:MAG: HigA family addiction module antitoxin [Terracidiphilus sp.]